MIDKRTLEIVLSEQKEELVRKARTRRCARKEESLVNLDSNMAQVVIGMRRSGKSTLCFNVLHNAGVKYAYVNFDDERFLNLKTDDLDSVLETLYKINDGSFTHLFLDEVQNVDGWHLFVNRLLRQGLRVIVTGSNAKLLSSELATYLTGRHTAIELFPFSFEEYCRYKNVDTTILTTQAEAVRRAAFDDYLRQGGFPELLQGADKRQYVSQLIDGILARDIRQRHNVRYFAAFERLAYHLMNIAPTVPDSEDLTKIFGFKSLQTTHNYIKYLKQAYLFIGLNRYSPKSRQRITGEKIYAVDVAIMDNRPDAFCGINLGWRLETIVYVELRRRAKATGCDVYYYKKNTRAKEVDFLLCKGNKVLQMYQVAYDISAEKTRKREFDSLVQASKATRCTELYLITDYERGTVEYDSVAIRIIPAYEWLLGRVD